MHSGRNISLENAVPSEQKDGLNLVASWTGGKDGCFACYRAMQAGHRIIRLLHFRNRKRSGSHELNPEVIRAQAGTIGIPLIQRDFCSYELEFRKAVIELRKQGVRVDGAVFGHIATHGELVGRICRALEIQPVMPLWKREPEAILGELIAAGFEAIVVSARGDLMGEEWLGRRIDRGFMHDLKRLDRSIDMCGENGEFHTLVTAGPVFRGRIAITRSERRLGDGYWHLDIQDFRIEE